MKNYLLVLLSVLGIGFFITYFAPDVEKNLSQELVPDAGQTVEAMLIPEREQVSELNTESLTEVAKITNTVTTSVKTKAATPVTVSSTTPSYTVTRFTSSLVKSPTYQDVYRTGNLIYAHNSKNLFGCLHNLRTGSVFNITEKGVTTTYVVSAIEHFKKVPVTNSNGATGEDMAKCNANYTDCSGRWMGFIVNTAFYHNVALMTCDGYGNTPYRLIILADKI